MAAMSLVCALPFIGNCVGGTVGLAIKFAGYGLTAFKGAVGTREAIDRAIEDYHNGALSWINALDIGLNAVTFVVGTTAFYKTGAELVRSEAGQKFLRNVAKGIKSLAIDNNGGYVILMRLSLILQIRGYHILSFFYLPFHSHLLY